MKRGCSTRYNRKRYLYKRTCIIVFTVLCLVFWHIYDYVAVVQAAKNKHESSASEQMSSKRSSDLVQNPGHMNPKTSFSPFQDLSTLASPTSEALLEPDPNSKKGQLHVLPTETFISKPAKDTFKSDERTYRFPDLKECDQMKERADSLPDFIMVPFQDTVSDVDLEGWEDLWVSKARYNGPGLEVPKIDFVFNCESSTHWKFQLKFDNIQGSMAPSLD